MYYYLKSEPGLWTVGRNDEKGLWNPESDHNYREDAARRVAFLNGGGQVPAAPASSLPYPFLEVIESNSRLPFLLNLQQVEYICTSPANPLYSLLTFVNNDDETLLIAENFRSLVTRIAALRP